jgi:hypothetical protein
MSVQINQLDFVKMVDHYLKKEIQASLEDFPNICVEDYFKEGLSIKEAKEICSRIKDDCLANLEG